MSLPSVLQEAFLSYIAKGDHDIQQCLTVESLWKKPSMYWFSAYYCKTTNQLIWSGHVIPRSGAEYDVFQIFEHGSTITVGDLLIDIMGLLKDYTDIVSHDEDKNRYEFLNKRLVDLKDAFVTINN